MSMDDFPRMWTYVDSSRASERIDASQRIDVTRVFNRDVVEGCTIADTRADVLAAGSATRLGARTEEESKGAIDMVGKPLSSFTMGKAALDGVPRFMIAAKGYWNKTSLYGKYKRGGGLMELWNTPAVEVDYQSNESPFGSADCVRRNLEELGGDKPTFVLQLDNVFGELDFKNLLGFSQRKMAFMTMVLTTVDNPMQYGTVRLDAGGRVTGMCEKSLLTLTEEDAARVKPASAVGESVKLTPALVEQLGLPVESVGYTHVVREEDAAKLDYPKMVGKKVGLSKTQLEELGYTKVNAGLYYLAPGARLVMNSQECLDSFASEGSDIGGNFIGWLLRQKFPVYGYVLEEQSPASMAKFGKVMWRDAGFPRELLETTVDIVQGRTLYYDIPGRVGDSDVFLMPGATDASARARKEILRQMRAGEVGMDTSEGRIVIGEDVEIAPGTVIKGPAYVGRKTQIGVKDARVKNTIKIAYASIEANSKIGIVDETRLQANRMLGNHVVVERSIVGEGTEIAGGAKERTATVITFSGEGKAYIPTLIGGDCRIGAGARLKGTEISPHHTIDMCNLSGAKFTSERVPMLLATTPEQEAIRREVEFSTPNPSPMHTQRMKAYQRKAREYALKMDADNMRFCLGRAAMEVPRLPTIVQPAALEENDRHSAAMESLQDIVREIELGKPELNLKEQTYARQAFRRAGVEAGKPTDNDAVKALKYLHASTLLLDHDERRSAEAVLEKAAERAAASSDANVRKVVTTLKPQLAKQIDISRMMKEMKQMPLVPGDLEAEERLRKRMGETTKDMLKAVADGLLPQDVAINTLNPKLADMRKRLKKRPA
jgi:NDP-sugar pyrophosphorylase family protein